MAGSILKACFLSLMVARRASGADTFTNPVLWQDHPDLDVFRVGDVFYYSSSTFAYSPGAPVLKSYNLVDWEPVSHSVPELNFGPAYNLDGSGRAYVKGIWASTLRYRESTDTFHWMGCIDQGKTHIWTAAGTEAGQNGGEVSEWTWTSHPPINSCYYDAGLLIDDDDKMYVAYGNTRISVAELSSDGLSQVQAQQVYSSDMTLEGARMYKINRYYYIFLTRPADAQVVLRSRDVFGPYEMRPFVMRVPGPLENAGFSHQGGIVDTPDGDWYYVAFMDAYPGGRIPVVAPMIWSDDGWPDIITDNDRWGLNYPMPVLTNKTVSPPLLKDDFKGEKLRHEWEWNHNPDNTKWSLAGDAEGGLTLQTATVTTDLFSARNTLTHRITGPRSIGTFHIDIGNMRAGDRAGGALFRDRAAYIGVWKEEGSAKLVMVNDLTMAEGSWETISEGKVAATGPVLEDGVSKVWLRVDADITPAFGLSEERKTTFSYSLDGQTFTRLGPEFAMSSSWRYFTGYRFGVFNHATVDLGGSVKVMSFSTEVVV